MGFLHHNTRYNIIVCPFEVYELSFFGFLKMFFKNIFLTQRLLLVRPSIPLYRALHKIRTHTKIWPPQGTAWKFNFTTSTDERFFDYTNRRLPVAAERSYRFGSSESGSNRGGPENYRVKKLLAWVWFVSRRFVYHGSLCIVHMLVWWHPVTEWSPKNIFL